VDLPRLNDLLDWKARHLFWPHPELLTKDMEDDLWRRCD
jgi:hypothetical protein